MKLNKANESCSSTPRKSQPEKQAPKKKPWFYFTPPFDIFGIQPSFFISGQDKTVTWLGFFSTIILLLALLAVSIFYTVNFFRNRES